MHGGPSAQNAITDSERRFIAEVKVDWNRNGLYDHGLSDMSGYITSVVVDRSLKGSLPGNLLLIEGSGAAQLELEVAGRYNGLPLEAVFSPFQVQGPFWGKQVVGAEIKYRIGVETVLGVVWYSQFVGRIRTVNPDRGANNVAFTALDRVEEMRKPVTFPAWAIYEYQRVVQGKVSAQLADPLWVIDHCLRFCDTSPTQWRPANRRENGLSDGDFTGVQLWVNGTGSICPTVGWMDNYLPQEFPSTFGEMYEAQGATHPNSPEQSTTPWAMGALGDNPGEDTLVYWVQDRDKITPRGMQSLGLTLVTRGRFPTYHRTVTPFEVMNVRVGWNNVIRLWIGNNQVYSTFYHAASATTYTTPAVTIPLTGDFHRINVLWDVFNAAGVKCWVRAGTNQSGSNWSVVGATPAATSANDFLQGRAETSHRVAWNDLYYTSTNFGTGSAAGDPLTWLGISERQAKYVAVLDKGLNRMSYLPKRKEEDSWSVISAVAEAEFGAVFWDEEGRFRFWNFDTIRMKQDEPVRELSLDDLLSLNATTTLDSVRNNWSVDAGQAVAYTDTVIETDSVDQFYIPAETTRSYRVWTDEAVSVNPGQPLRYTTVASPNPANIPMWGDQFQQGYVLQFLESGVWGENNNRASGVDITSYQDGDGGLVVRIRNGWEVPVRFATNGGAPAFRIVGTRIRTGDNQRFTFASNTSIDRYGLRDLNLSGDWFQEFSNFNGVVDKLVLRTSNPIPSTDGLSIPGDPRLQLGDTVRVNDRFNFGERIDCQIFGIRRSYSLEAGLTDELSVEIVRPSGGLWDDAVYGRWDQTLMWGA